jgi:hypothetical protein
MITSKGNNMTHTLFKVSGPHTNLVYYGYAITGKEQATFMAGCNRTDNEKRGDARMLEANENDAASLQFDMLCEYEEEFDAWTARNDNRAGDACSITGPTMFPVESFRRAAKDFPEVLSEWKLRAKQKDASTALEAYQLGAYTFAQISELCKSHTKDAIMSQLSALTPVEFANLYGI